MTCWLVHAGYSLPEWQAVKRTFFAPWKTMLWKTIYCEGCIKPFHLILSRSAKQMVLWERSAKVVIFEWSHILISFTVSKVRPVIFIPPQNTLQLRGFRKLANCTRKRQSFFWEFAPPIVCFFCDNKIMFWVRQALLGPSTRRPQLANTRN